YQLMSTLLRRPFLSSMLTVSGRRRVTNRIMIVICILATVLTVGAMLLVIGYVCYKGVSSLSLNVFTNGPAPQGEPNGGLLNGIVGTLELLGLGSIFGIPLGIFGGIYQAESKSKLASFIRLLTDVLNSIPSIVLGLFAYVIVVLPMAQLNPGHAFSLFAGSIALGIIMIPTIIRTTEEILKLVPNGLREASLALGASEARTMFSVILPAAREGIITGIMLAIARIAGETAPLLFTAFGNMTFSMAIDEPIDALPLNIYKYATSPWESLHNLAFAGALILISFILILSILTRYILRNKMVH
ncbi:MAG TPA: phosphate ABC transporter permease PstA, partial [Candidatus Kapabacteria bacterium]|nr:phosphate ABC transporter permease PstA [Candidatus Kapabacteria bacterium]